MCGYDVCAISLQMHNSANTAKKHTHTKRGISELEIWSAGMHCMAYSISVVLGKSNNTILYHIEELKWKIKQQQFAWLNGMRWRKREKKEIVQIAVKWMKDRECRRNKKKVRESTHTFVWTMCLYAAKSKHQAENEIV